MDPQHGQSSHLFLIRFWKEGAQEPQGSQGRKEWHGRVQHVLRGEAHTFESWPMLIDLLLEMAETELIEAVVPAARATQETAKKEALP